MAPRYRGAPPRPTGLGPVGYAPAAASASSRIDEGLVDLGGRRHQRRDDPDDVHVRARRQDDELACQRLGLDPLGQVGIGRPAVACVRLDELDRDHQAKAARVADRAVLPGEPVEAGKELVATLPGVGDQPFLLDDIKGGVRGGARDDVAAVRPAVGAGLPGGHQLGPCQDPGEWQARRDALGHDQDVGLDVPVPDREHLAGPPEPGLDLVGDEQDAVLAGDLAEPWQEPRRRHDVAALAEDRLEDDRGDVLRVDELVERQVELGLPVARARVRGVRRHRAPGSSTDRPCGRRSPATARTRPGRRPWRS